MGGPSIVEQPPVQDTPAPPPVPPQGHAVAIVRHFHTIVHTTVIFLSVFLVIRTVIVEPFGVPTGSMAPTFIGNHREGSCPRCGNSVRVGTPSRGGPDPFPAARCQNCGKRGIDLSKMHEVPGDRLLVDKNVFSARSPRRWEIAVFRCPVDLTIPYVKRVVGLPGESLQIIGGDVWINGILARKTLAEVRESSSVVYDFDHAPATGWGPRWLVEPVADNPKLPQDPSFTPVHKAESDILRPSGIHLSANTEGQPALGLTYRHWDLDQEVERPITDWLSYNGRPADRGEPVHDFLLSFELVVNSGSGLFACRLADGADTVMVELPIGTASPRAGVRMVRDGSDPPQQGEPLALNPGQSYFVEFALVDRRASLAINGTEVVPPLDLHAEPARLERRGLVTRPMQLGVRGASVTISHLKLARDAHYRTDESFPSGCNQPVKLGEKEYFLLGDNSSHSSDSRNWKDEKTGIHIPGVPESHFIGKPFLIHQPLKAGQLSVNGQDHTIQTIDWSRMKWLR